MSSSSWQELWDKAQPKLVSIRETLNSNSSPDPRVIRVGQLDSELLDQELVNLLQEPLSRALSLFNASFRMRIEPELALLIRLTLYKLSTWSIGASYGAKLQDLRYHAPHSPSLSLSPSGLPRRTLLIHGTLTIIVPYCHTRLRAYALSQAWPDAPSSDRKRKAWDILTSLESSHTLLGLLNFIAFLWDGRYRTIADRILNMRLVPSHKLVKRDVSYEFMNRQMVWHNFTEFLLFLLPLISARSLRHRLNRLSSILSPTSLAYLLSAGIPSALGIASPSSKSAQPGVPPKRGKYYILPQDQCAICAENASFSLNLADPANAFTSFTTPLRQHPTTETPPQISAESDIEPPAYPIHTPYVTSCGDVYCYHCIAERMMHSAEDGGQEGWECLRCGQGVKWVERFLVDTGGSEMSGSDYEFSSDMDLDVTDMSESAGSYSEMGLSD